MLVDLRLVSCLTKVFPDEAPAELKYAPESLIGENAAFQICYKGTDSTAQWKYLDIEIDSPIKQYIELGQVRYVPVRYTNFAESPENMLRMEPGMFPDYITPLHNNKVKLFYGCWDSIWAEIKLPDDVPGGDYPITVKLTADGETVAKRSTVYHRIAAKLPAQKLIHTRWFHNDGLCTYYKVEMFSEEWWCIAENFVKGAVDMAVNCLLTPIHTPPLDTQVGGERLTCQLVDVTKTAGVYSFGFERFERWVKMAQKCGIVYFEMAHLFTQWGAEHAPKIMATVDGEYKRIFGWETEAAGAEYVEFLNAYLTAIKAECAKLNILDKCIFHISDEPNINHIDNYMKARKAVEEQLKGFLVVDALSNIEMYESGACEHPVPSINHIKPFIEAKIPGLWAYYCVGQHKLVSNAFIAMPSARTRIIGIQMYKYDIAGFLQWGYNFYNSQFSRYPINPYMTNDGDGFSPAGDCFMVYPGDDGQPLPTLRSKAFAQAVWDMRAFDLLESLTDKQTVMDIIEAGIEPIEFDCYPWEQDYLFEVRRRVNEKIEKKITEG